MTGNNLLKSYSTPVNGSWLLAKIYNMFSKSTIFLKKRVVHLLLLKHPINVNNFFSYYQLCVSETRSCVICARTVHFIVFVVCVPYFLRISNKYHKDGKISLVTMKVKKSDTLRVILKINCDSSKL